MKSQNTGFYLRTSQECPQRSFVRASQVGSLVARAAEPPFTTLGQGTGAATKSSNFETAAPKPLAFGQLGLCRPKMIMTGLGKVEMSS
jgi:hypothetical protein